MTEERPEAAPVPGAAEPPSSPETEMQPLAKLAKLIGVHRDTLLTYVTDGFLAPDGSRVFLTAIRNGRGWESSVLYYRLWQLAYSAALERRRTAEDLLISVNCALSLAKRKGIAGAQQFLNPLRDKMLALMESCVGMEPLEDIPA